ncbi:uncharacterized protein AKAW2_51133S [Aspergillus luchuensis]|uniref:Uncharacterized protein n=2 Tax=Aspergillus kawachii TaxID=1069201 RepID=A0A7R7X1Y5_ASPKA|nr:uncharacterized protein AKAW2_51133S [Aspergillus luchuensis]BCS00792.1 hypothetical protein AKAW2_51133S [Aspergillus luchuensis]BCS12554.1 hypothetical protein ALUC_50600S [Aspergillus luchuensis]
MSMNESHSGRGLGFAIRTLFRSSPSPSPTPTPRHRVSLLRRGRSIFSSRNPRNSSKPSSGSPMHDFQQFNSAAMVGLAQASAGDNFDIFQWHPRYQSCQRYFLDHAQHSDAVQALSAFLNIRLPFQWQSNPVVSSHTDPSRSAASQSSTSSPASNPPPSVSLIPYIRRLVATGMDFPGVLHGFFGDEWGAGIGPLHEQERRNYLFAAKSGGWAAVKKDYDMPPLETIPFLRPLQGPLDSEIEAAERSWSEWLAMEDWMVGPRAPDVLQDSSSQISRHHSSRG